MGTQTIDDRGSPDHVAVDQDLVGHVAAEFVDAVLAVQQPVLGEPRFPRTDEGRGLPVVAEQMIREVEVVAGVQRAQRILQMVGPPRIVGIEKCDVRRAVGDCIERGISRGARAGISLPDDRDAHAPPGRREVRDFGDRRRGRAVVGDEDFAGKIAPLLKDRRQCPAQDAGLVLIMGDDYRNPALTPRHLDIGTRHFFSRFRFPPGSDPAPIRPDTTMTNAYSHRCRAAALLRPTGGSPRLPSGAPGRPSRPSGPHGLAACAALTAVRRLKKGFSR